ncbi:hypothetical protein QJS10_CPB15g01477 [Acorus calamus]|uniref:Uncharacterized protein n=1 Tax=Acorus calamus TaxID=4465 RepID=A0AAV9D9E9_ACOCL|nr:hypothetical protein QJS10_CPB15g01477 [Acorus calamus]
MSRNFWVDAEYSVDVDELSLLGTKCVEIKRERDMLRDSLLCEQAKNAELIKRLESDINAMSEERSQDKKYIKDLERSLENCSQEIGFLQNQLNLKNVEADYMAEHVHSLELKLLEVGNLHEKVRRLGEEIVKSDSQCLSLIHKLENKEAELRNCTLCVEKLETAVSSIALDSQCEIESMKLDLAALEQKCFEAEEFSEQLAEDNSRAHAAIEELEVRFEESRKMISHLQEENSELQEKLALSKSNTKIFFCKAEKYLDRFLKDDKTLTFYMSNNFDKVLWTRLGDDFTLLAQMCDYEEVLGPFLSKLAVVTAWDENMKDDIEKMSNQIHESELLVKQLKEELREEKLKAKEEGEDLTQEMAEFRYQVTGMLEEECKRRAHIERASLRRIAELETQVRKEQMKSYVAARRLREAEALMEKRLMEVHLSKNSLEEPCQSEKVQYFWRNETCSCGDCVFPETTLNCSIEQCISGDAVEAHEKDPAQASIVLYLEGASVEQNSCNRMASTDIR